MSQHRQLLNPAELHPAPGFSHVAIAEGTRVVHLAGQVALDREFGIVGGEDLGEQTKAAMRNVELALTAAGATWDDVVRRTIYTLHPTEYETITAAIDDDHRRRRPPRADDRRHHRPRRAGAADRDRVHGRRRPLTDMTPTRDTRAGGPDMSGKG